jgi:hypothetical protein
MQTAYETRIYGKCAEPKMNVTASFLEGMDGMSISQECTIKE